MGGLPDENHVKVCSNWLAKFALPCGRWWYGGDTGEYSTSYGLKHTVERWADEYVTNGSFIEAVDRRGIAWKPSFKGSPNAIFKMKIGKVSTKGRGPGVYVVRCESYHKIGISDNIHRRLKQLDAASPFELELIHVIRSPFARELEKELHDRYSAKRVKGEWFELEPRDILDIKNWNWQ